LEYLLRGGGVKAVLPLEYLLGSKGGPSDGISPGGKGGPSGRIMAPVSTQSVIEMSTRNISLGERRSFRPHYGPGVDSGSNRNEYQEYILGGKGGPSDGISLGGERWSFRWNISWGVKVVIPMEYLLGAKSDPSYGISPGG